MKVLFFPRGKGLDDPSWKKDNFMVNNFKNSFKCQRTQLSKQLSKWITLIIICNLIAALHESNLGESICVCF